MDVSEIATAGGKLSDDQIKNHRIGNHANGIKITRVVSGTTQERGRRGKTADSERMSVDLRNETKPARPECTRRVTPLAIQKGAPKTQNKRDSNDDPKNIVNVKLFRMRFQRLNELNKMGYQCRAVASDDVRSATLALSNTVRAPKPAHSVTRGSHAAGVGSQCQASVDLTKFALINLVCLERKKCLFTVNINLTHENVRAMIFYGFCWHLNQQENYNRLRLAFRDEAQSLASVYNCFNEFKRGRTNPTDNLREGRPSTAATEDNISVVQLMIKTD
ncbi:Putative uncharacterized protein FLJ37770 [Eumeta japonica]|uniref:Mos1 transposase HTH domain-containing protein n=1 Tax=Eumeta variegata TaxID=151549 RepID=A0A4C1U940_EUMVA|nr:Putative uncharacterized protein FLJ37770 [Eumeta japonica]